MHSTLTTWLVASMLVLTACADSENPAGTAAPRDATDNAAAANGETGPLVWHRAGHRATLVEAVEAWNDNIETFGRLASVGPPVEARMSAMANTTVHDILNAVDRRFEPYAYDGLARKPVSVEAAIATGAHDVLSAIGGSPDATAFIDEQYSDYMATLGAGDEITRGIQLGKDAAAAMIALRANDGSAGPPVAIFTSTGEPGKFRSPIGNATDLTGPQALQNWGLVRPFVLAKGDQFRSPPMYGAATVEDAVKTAAYLADYAEVKRLGGTVSERTPDQTEIAFFWIESTIQGWNRIARTLGERRQLDAWKLARLLAHVGLAEADAYISTFETKYHYNFWRPITAIRLGNLDPSTPGDPAWDVASMLRPELGPTPPIPDYNSGHSIAGAAAAEAIIANIPGTTAFTTTSGTLPGTSRSFRSVVEAARENADSRVYIGFHFRHATDQGVEAGRQVGQYVGQHSLQRSVGPH